MSGLDSDVGVYRLLSRINVNTLLLGTDIGTATKKLHTWQIKLPQILTNFIYDSYDIKHTKSEGSIECENKGVSGFMGGNVPLGSEPFTVRDVSRIIQRQIPPHKSRRAKMLYDVILKKVDLSKLTSKALLSYHVFCALIMKGHIQNWSYEGKRVVCVITDEMAKKIGVFIFKNYIPVIEHYTEQEIYQKQDEILESIEEQTEDVNAIQRILAQAHMLVMNSCIDNLLNRPYKYENGVIKIYPNVDDLAVMKIILDDYFWEQKRQELIEQKLMIIKADKPEHMTPYRYYYNLLKKEPNQFFTAKELYNKALRKLVVDDKLMGGEQFYALYGAKDEVRHNHRLRSAMEKLRKQRKVLVLTDVKPFKYCFKKSGSARFKHNINVGYSTSH